MGVIRDRSRAVEIKSWARRHASCQRFDCSECNDPIEWGVHVRRVYRIEYVIRGKNKTSLEVRREHECCPEKNVS